MKETMSVGLVRYTEPLEAEELQFLETRESKDRKVYYQVYRLLMLLSFVIPFAGAWYRAYDGAENAFSLTKFFFSAAVLLSISTFSTYMVYRVNLRRIQMDIRHKTKTIETSKVMRKLYLSVKSTHYFYIDSRIKMSIEVSPTDYERIKEGDEVCIEYTTHSKQYLGYF
jgi:uncharacterized membrane protein